MKRKIVQAKTVNQKEYVRSIIENDITICAGPAGTGKTLMALSTAFNQLEMNVFDKLLICRTMETSGRAFGAVPGDLNEKFEPYIIPYVQYLKELFGEKEFQKEVASERILLRPIEIIRGHTYDKTFMILEEAQNCTPAQLKLFITRAGEDAKIVIVGDPRQSDINGDYNALDFAMAHIGDAAGCSLIEMDYNDVQRNKKLAHVIKIFDDNNIQ